MKRICIFLFSIVAGLIFFLPIDSLGYTFSDNYKWKYDLYQGAGSYYYVNVNIDDIYYDIAIYDPKIWGPVNVTSVSVNYAKTKGSTLTIPETICFKENIFKVNYIYINDTKRMNSNGKWKLPYKNIIIPKSVKSADFQFAKLTNIEKIYVPKKTKVLEGLSGYPKLKVIIDKNNPYIKMKNGAIYSKDGKKLLSLVNSKNTYRVSKGTKEINFYSVKNLKKVYLPSSLETITKNSFEECSNLKKVKIGNKTKKIGSSAFNDCNSLKKLNIPNSLEKISDSAFEKCKSLNKIVLPKKLDKIGLFAFKDCINLSKVTLEGEEKAPIIGKESFKNTKDGIQFIVKNQTVADQLKGQLNGSKVKNAKILIGKKVVYKNING